MIFSIVHSTGWTIDYIYWHISPQQLVLFSAAANEVLGTKDADKKGKKPAKEFESMSSTEQAEYMSDIFGVPVEEG